MGNSDPCSKVLMIRPANFGYNFETAGDNSFQKQPTETGTTVQA